MRRRTMLRNMMRMMGEIPLKQGKLQLGLPSFRDKKKSLKQAPAVPSSHVFHASLPKP